MVHHRDADPELNKKIIWMFWVGLITYGLLLLAAVLVDWRQSLDDKIVFNFWVIVTILLFNTLATLLQYKAIFTIKKEIVTQMVMKENSRHIAFNLTIFGLVNFSLLANLAAISYARRN